VNSRWSRTGAALVLAALSLAGCREKTPAERRASASPEDQAQQDAELLARELTDIVDRVMSFKSSHRGQLPASLRQAGLDSLTPRFVRRLAREGGAPRITILFRNQAGRRVASCSGTNMVLEDAMLHGGEYGVECSLVGGGSQRFTIPPPPPPKS